MKPSVQRILAIGWAEWRRLRREPSALLFLVVLPLAVVSVLGPVYVSENSGEDRVGVVAEASGPLADLVVRRLAEPGGLDVRRYDTRSGAEDGLRDRSVDAVVVIPGEGDLVLVGAPGVVAPAGIRGTVERTAADVTALLSIAGDDPDPEALVQAEQRLAEALPPRAGRVDLGSDERRASALATALIGVTVLFTFLNTMAGDAVPFYREQGLLGRLRASGMTATETAAGFALWLFVFATVQASLLLVGSTVILGVSWPDPGPLLAVTVVSAGAAGGLGALTGSFLPSASSGITVAGPVGFTLGMLGGTLWPLEFVPPVARAIGHLTPQAWAVDAFNAAGGFDETDRWVRPTAVLAVFAVVLLLGASVRLRRSLARAG